MKKLTIGLIGNPNSGKTTLFNQLTGARQRVGNWAGVTVERKEGQFATTDHQVTLVDLPGTYSLTTISSQTSLDEQIACHYILSGDADLLINVVDASNLERNLYLTLQLLELGIPCIVALNMLDIAEKQQVRIDVDALSTRLGCPVVPLVSTRGRGIEALKLAIDRHNANDNVELVHYAQPLVPQIGMMYLFLSLLEDSGYMARAAFVMDRLMQALGLPGKSFVPLIVGFGCNVPSVMGARTLDAPRERLMTIMMAPFMSCGARLAIFAVFAAAFFGQNGALAVFSLYVLGIVMAVLTGLMLKHTIMRGEASPFVMELPVYHVPHIKSLIIQTWQRLKGFVLRAGKVIIIVSIFLSAFNSFSLSGKIVDNINDSALASVSRVITPVFKPIGVHEDNWQATVGLFTGAMAKEVVVGTLNTLYTAENIQDEAFNPADFHLGDELLGAVDDTWQSLKDTFSLSVLANPIEASKGDGEMATGAMGVMDQKFGNAAAAYSYLIFVLLYVPCISVMGAIARESSRGWMGFSILWGLNIAYSLATLFYQVTSFSQHPTYSLICILAVIVFNVVVLSLLRRARSRVDIELLATRKNVSSCCSGTAGNCH